MKFLSLILLFTPWLAAQSVYYVATDGNDSSGNGSSSNPWATISRAVQQVPDDGSTVIVRNGTYTGRVQLNRQFTVPMLIRAENPLQAKLRNANDLAVYVYGGTGMELSGFDIAKTNPQTSSPLLMHIGPAKNFVLRNNFIHESYNNDLIKINERASNIVIIGNLFRNQAGGAGQHLDINGCTNVLIKENIFFNDAASVGQSSSVTAGTNGFIVIKNSGGFEESRRTRVAGNIFMNYQGLVGSAFVLVGEDGKPFHEAQEIDIENNLILGNSSMTARTSFSVKGGRDVLFRNNTVAGSLPSSAYVVRIQREGSNPVIDDVRMLNNIWSDPTGTMTGFSDGAPSEGNALTLLNNLYWNGGYQIPTDGDILNYFMDPQAQVADPRLPGQSGMVLPNWQGTSFPSGTTSIRAEFERIVNGYGRPAAGSPVQDRSDTAESPEVDMLDAARGTAPDQGAVEVGGATPAVRLVLLRQRVMGGATMEVNRVLLSAPAGASGAVVSLASSNSGVASVPATVLVPAGETSQGFAVTTNTVSSPVPVTIRATSGGTTASLTLLVVPQGVVSLNPSKFMPVAGDTDHKLMIEGPASGPVAIRLSSSRPDIVSFPNGVTVGTGQAWGTFTTRFQVVQQATPVTITAALGSTSASSIITVQPGGSALPPATTGVTIASIQPTVSSLASLASTTVQITLAAPAPAGGAVIQLSANPATAVSLPASVTFPAGTSTMSFSLSALSVLSITPVTMTATPSTGSSMSAALQIDPPVVVPPVNPPPTTPPPTTPPPSTPPAGASWPASVYGPVTAISGGQINVTVFMNQPDSNPVNITFQSSRPDLVTSSNAIVPAGSNRAAVPLSFASVTANTSITLSFTANGVTKSTSITLLPPSVTYHAVDSRYVTVKGGTTIPSIIVMLSATVTSNTTIALTSSDPAVIPVPASLTVTAGSDRIYYSVTTNSVSAPVTVTLSAVSGGVTKSTTVTVTP